MNRQDDDYGTRDNRGWRPVDDDLRQRPWSGYEGPSFVSRGSPESYETQRPGDNWRSYGQGGAGEPWQQHRGSYREPWEGQHEEGMPPFRGYGSGQPGGNRFPAGTRAGNAGALLRSQVGTYDRRPSDERQWEYNRGYGSSGNAYDAESAGPDYDRDRGPGYGRFEQGYDAGRPRSAERYGSTAGGRYPRSAPSYAGGYAPAQSSGFGSYYQDFEEDVDRLGERGYRSSGGQYQPDYTRSPRGYGNENPYANPGGSPAYGGRSSSYGNNESIWAGTGEESAYNERWGRRAVDSYGLPYPGSSYANQQAAMGATGPHAGRGPRGYQRSDERIREDVSERLSEHEWIDATRMEVRSDGGIVTLSGEVDSRRQKRLAEDVAEGVPGVKDVHNELRVTRFESSAGGSMGRSGSSTSAQGAGSTTAPDGSGYTDLPAGAETVSGGGSGTSDQKLHRTGTASNRSSNR